MNMMIHTERAQVMFCFLLCCSNPTKYIFHKVALTHRAVEKYSKLP